jgi:hypothetical protein
MLKIYNLTNERYGRYGDRVDWYDFETASAKNTFARKMATSSSRTTGSSFGIKNPIKQSIDKNQPGTT